MKVERREIIRAALKNREFIGIHELEALCPDVSLMTIHRDLDALEQEGVLVKVRGGARVSHLMTEPMLNVRSQLNVREKQAIARKALPLILPGSTVFLDAGSTSLILAGMIPDTNISVFTTGPSIALELCRLTMPSINLCGGSINRANLALSGQATLDALDKINIDVAFLGASGCVAGTGFVCGRESEMLVKRRVLEKARMTVVLCDSSKFGRILPYTFASMKDVDALITNAPLPEELAADAADAKLRIL